jgi:hypothetical protein
LIAGRVERSVVRAEGPLLQGRRTRGAGAERPERAKRGQASREGRAAQETAPIDATWRALPFLESHCRSSLITSPSVEQYVRPREWPPRGIAAIGP